jgi:hypothetical protein
MNKPTIAKYLLIVTIWSTQCVLAMELLPQELQYKILDLVDNKTSMQHVNKKWNETKSIKNPIIFSFVHLTNKKMTCVLLSAAYWKNYAGVDNILKNTNILAQTPNRLPFYQMGTFVDGKRAIIDLRSIVELMYDQNLANILNAYNIPAFNPNQVISEQYPYRVRREYFPLYMMCFTGTYNVGHLQAMWRKSSKPFLTPIEIKFLFNIIIDFDRVKAFKILYHEEQDNSLCIKSIINWELLERACIQKSKNVLKELLELKKNDAKIAKAVDDLIMQYAKKNQSDFDEIIRILRESGAKNSTMKEQHTINMLNASIKQYDQINILQVPQLRSSFKENLLDFFSKGTYGFGLISVVTALCIAFVYKK